MIFVVIGIVILVICMLRFGVGCGGIGDVVGGGL